jgi:hypothetical protein
MGVITCLSILPKNRFFIAGDKEGNLGLFDLTNSECV